MKTFLNKNFLEFIFLIFKDKCVKKELAFYEINGLDLKNFK